MSGRGRLTPDQGDSPRLPKHHLAGQGESLVPEDTKGSHTSLLRTANPARDCLTPKGVSEVNLGNGVSRRHGDKGREGAAASGNRVEDL